MAGFRDHVDRNSDRLRHVVEVRATEILYFTLLWRRLEQAQRWDAL